MTFQEQKPGETDADWELGQDLFSPEYSELNMTASLTHKRLYGPIIYNSGHQPWPRRRSFSQILALNN